MEIKDIYKTLIDTRNFEINSFWQRSNYFLVLNSGIAFGFFNQKDNGYTLVFGILGVFASVLWFWVTLGGKFWQTRWEQELLEFEAKNLPDLKFFSATKEEVRERVKEGLSFNDLSFEQRQIYKLVMKKPSVSFAMIMLSLLSLIGWVGFVGVYIYMLG